MIAVKPSQRMCATCASWFGGKRVFDKGQVKFDASPQSTGQCTHPVSGKKGQQVKSQYGCSRWTQAFS